MKTVAVILARGGSEGIRKKNLTPVGGVPLVVRAVRAAARANSVDRVIVSTDDQEIALIAGSNGAHVIERPSHLAGADVSSEDALLHVLESLEEPFDIVAMIQCTSPFIEPSDIDATVGLVASGGVDSAFTATKFHGFLWENPEQPTGLNHDATRRLRRQVRSEEFLETGAVYAMSVPGLFESRHRFFGRVGIYEVPRTRSLEIDTPDDLEIANAISQAIGPTTLPIGPIEALAMDFDGVLTNNQVIVFEDGTEAVTCDRSDGLGISKLLEQRLPMIVLSTEIDPVVGKRCEKLGVPWRQGLTDKRQALEEWLDEIGVEEVNVAFVGNDVNDLDAMRSVGWAIAPEDAHPDVLREARVVLRATGGRGAIRELADRVTLGTAKIEDS